MVSLAKYQTAFKELNEEEEEGMDVWLAENIEEVEEGSDEAELLVVRRVLSRFATQDDMEQREAIFHTRWTWEAMYAHSSLMKGVVPLLHPKPWRTSSS